MLVLPAVYYCLKYGCWPVLVLDRWLSFPILDRLEKYGQKINLGGLTISNISNHTNPDILQLSGQCKCGWQMNTEAYLIDPVRQYLAEKVLLQYCETNRPIFRISVVFHTSFLHNKFGDPPLFWISDHSGSMTCNLTVVTDLGKNINIRKS